LNNRVEVADAERSWWCWAVVLGDGDVRSDTDMVPPTRTVTV
jgi:hypothetical protein